MAKSDTPRRITEHLLVQQIGLETLVYDQARHLAFCLNASSAAVWRLADGTRGTRQIAVETSAELGVEMDEDLVDYAIDTLRSDGLIEAASAGDSAAGGARSISRRAMLQRLGVGGAMLLPVVASIVAPTAAQAYNGCVDCSTSNARATRVRRLQQNKASQ